MDVGINCKIEGIVYDPRYEYGSIKENILLEGVGVLKETNLDVIKASREATSKLKLNVWPFFEVEL